MPALMLSAPDLALLRRCFGAATTALASWEDDADTSVTVAAVMEAGAILAAAWPGGPTVFPAAPWDAFTSCCEVGAEMLDETRPDSLTDAEYRAVIRLLQSAFAHCGG